MTNEYIGREIYNMSYKLVERYSRDKRDHYEFDYEDLSDKDKYKFAAVLFEEDSYRNRYDSYSKNRNFAQVIEDNFECIRENDYFETIMDSFRSMLYLNDSEADEEFLSCIKNNVINYYEPRIRKHLDFAFYNFIEFKDSINDETYYDWNYAA
jgi:hypothetical protein